MKIIEEDCRDRRQRTLEQTPRRKTDAQSHRADSAKVCGKSKSWKRSRHRLRGGTKHPFFGEKRLQRGRGRL